MSRSLGPVASDKEPELTPEEIATFEEYPDVDRPKTRGDCWDFANDKPIGTRPCPFVTCRYNNYLDLTPKGTIMLTWPERQPEDVPPGDSCALDMAEQDYESEANLGSRLGLTTSGVQARIYSAQKSARAIRSRLLRVINSRPMMPRSELAKTKI